MSEPRMNEQSEAKIIDGRHEAYVFRQKIAKEIDRFQDERRATPGLAVVLVGDDPASKVYIASIAGHAKETGMGWFERTLPADATEDELLTVIRGLNKNAKVNGILLPRPLPERISAAVATRAVDPDKDVDGTHVVNAGRLFAGEPGLAPCTALACLKLLKGHLGDLSGRRATVIGRSAVVGKPVALMLASEDCTVTLAHSRTLDLAAECRKADILVAAAGSPRLVKGDWIKPGATVIDVGINKIEKKDAPPEIVGDVDFEAARKTAGAITPVPGGVGPMTIACQLANTVIAACRKHGIDAPDFL